MKYLTHLDLNKNELRNAVIQPLASAPSSPTEGQIYYNTTDDTIYIWANGAWLDLGAQGVGDMTAAMYDPQSIEDDAFNVDNHTDGTTNKVYTAVEETKLAGIETAADVTDATNVAAAGAVMESDTSTASMSFVVDEDNMASNSATKIPTQQSVKAYADGLLGTNDAMIYKGAIDASANPNYPAASAGDTYKISVAGKIGGASGPDVTVGDTIIATADGLSAGNHATVGASWNILQANVDRATNATLGLAEYATAGEAEARTDSTVALTPVSVANFPVKKIFTIGDASATQIDVTHSLGTKEVITQVRQASDDAVVECDITNFSTSVVRLNFAVAPASNAIKVVVMG